jgi:hypothetical protein
MLAMLAHTFLAVMASLERAKRDDPADTPDLVDLTQRKICRLLAKHEPDAVITCGAGTGSRDGLDKTVPRSQHTR